METDNTPKLTCILAIQISKGMLGATSFLVSKKELSVMEDTREDSGFDVSKKLLRQIVPDLVIINDKDKDLAAILGKTIPIVNVTPSVVLRPASEFSSTSGFSRLVVLCSGIALSEISAEANKPTKKSQEAQTSLNSTHLVDSFNVDSDSVASQWVSSIVGNDSQSSIACVNAMILYLQTKGLEIGYTNGNMSSGLIKKLKKLTLEPFMFIGTDTIQALEILTSEKHPNMHIRSKRAKEGLSLFGLLDLTKTPGGRHMLQMWMLRPFQTIEEIHSRQSNIEFMLKKGFVSNMPRYLASLSKIKKVETSLDRLWFFPSLSDWQVILKIEEAVDIENVKSLGALIANTIDFQSSVIEYRTVVKSNLDPELDKLHEIYNGLASFLTNVAQNESAGLPDILSETMTVVYFPQLGYLISLELLKVEECPDSESYLGTWDQQFCTDGRVYYKNPGMIELDEYFGDIHAHIVDIEIEIIQQLKQEIRAYTDVLTEIVLLCSEFDCLLSLAQVAKNFNWVKPTISQESQVVINKGRHPIIEVLLGNFIPNDTAIRLSDNDYQISNSSFSNNQDNFNGLEKEVDTRFKDHQSFNKPKDFEKNLDEKYMEYKKTAMVITGSNYSGKSIYAKQVALIVYLAHIGSYVPAKSAVIGITDRIETRIRASESLLENQSSFMRDLQQVSQILRNCTSKSLVILDEFGKGTLWCGTFVFSSEPPCFQKR
ncbi:hypothetical protein BB559_003801 [Furculomyces boomerangus]|uniref:DNA mismatch repair proteins mutS family domain-containing protein n=1 Tax=Furculomyces boomerangus TaxID=61424 RepID=A0A2T9YIP1_9FUNG|nr:hypothetical protein BB559_003801 [Furculomyces boomerangus]